MVLSDADTLMKLNPFWTILLSLIFLKRILKVSNYSYANCYFWYVIHC